MTHPTDVDLQLPSVSDDEMAQARAGARGYTIAILKRGPAYSPPHSDAIILAHARRNFRLRAAGLLVIVCPISDGTEVAGIGIFDADTEAVERIMRGDPAIQANVLTWETHPAFSFPGDALPPRLGLT